MGRNISCPFASTQHFLDLYINSDEFKTTTMQNIIEEKYHISKRLHTSFTELDDITPMERKALLRLIVKDLEEQKRIMEAARAKANN